MNQSERILKIGQRLAKLRACSVLFFGSQCTSLP